MGAFSRFTLMSVTNYDASTDDSSLLIFVPSYNDSLRDVPTLVPSTIDAAFLLIGVSLDEDSPLRVRAFVRSTMDTIRQTHDRARFSVTKLRSSQARRAPIAGPFTDPVTNDTNLDNLLTAINPLHDENNENGTISLCKKELLKICHRFPCLQFR